jgi:CheY-like chemotaxis protein
VSAAELPARRHEPIDRTILGGQERILLAEDDADVAALASRVLQEAGYQLLLAMDGKNALELVVENDFQADLLVTDLIMPGMNGKELAEKIKEKLPGIRILFSSGYTDNHLVHNGQLDSEIDFLQKPYSPIDLLKKVRQVLKK